MGTNFVIAWSYLRGMHLTSQYMYLGNYITLLIFGSGGDSKDKTKWTFDNKTDVNACNTDTFF